MKHLLVKLWGKSKLCLDYEHCSPATRIRHLFFLEHIVHIDRVAVSQPFIHGNHWAT